MWQMVFTDISVKGWIIDPDIKSFFMAVLRFWSSLPHYVEVINTYTVTSVVEMVKYGRGGLLVFLEPLSKGP